MRKLLEERSLFLESIIPCNYNNKNMFFSRFNKKYKDNLDRDLVSLRRELQILLLKNKENNPNIDILFESILRDHFLDRYLIDIIVADYFVREENHRINKDTKDIIDICEIIIKDNDDEIKTLITSRPEMIKTLREYKKRCLRQSERYINQMK